MLLRDAKEYAEGSGFENILTEYINQLKPTNVFPSSFDFKLNLEELKSKFIWKPPKETSTDDYFEMMLTSKCDFKIKEVDEFKSYFSCGICFKVIDACRRLVNKTC